MYTDEFYTEKEESHTDAWESLAAQSQGRPLARWVGVREQFAEVAILEWAATGQVIPGVGTWVSEYTEVRNDT